MASRDLAQAASTQAFLEASVEFEPNTGCWLWAKALRKGYGDLWRRGFARQAHRASWQAYNGPIPEGLCVLHRCDTPACVNPAHLSVGTHRDNMREMALRGRTGLGPEPRLFCRRGHPAVAGAANCRDCNRMAVTAYRARKRQALGGPHD